MSVVKENDFTGLSRNLEDSCKFWVADSGRKEGADSKLNVF